MTITGTVKNILNVAGLVKTKPNTEEILEAKRQEAIAQIRDNMQDTRRQMENIESVIGYCYTPELEIEYIRQLDELKNQMNNLILKAKFLHN